MVDSNNKFDLFGTPEQRKKYEQLMGLLNRLRQENPQHVTEREIQLIENIYKLPQTMPEFVPIEIFQPTILRNPSQEQLETLIKLDNLYTFSDIYHNLHNTPTDRDIAKNIINAATKSRSCYIYYKKFAEMDNDRSNHLINDPELTTLMLKNFTEEVKQAENTSYPNAIKEFLIKVAPISAKHPTGKTTCIQLMDEIHNKEKQNFMKIFDNNALSRPNNDKTY